MSDSSLASVIWGLIGPQRIFSPGQIYSGLFYFFGVGAVMPIVFYFAARKFPASPIKYLMAPLIFGGATSIPPATPLNYLSWGVVGLLFSEAHQTTILSLVVETELPYQLWLGSRIGIEHIVHFLRLYFE